MSSKKGNKKGYILLSISIIIEIIATTLLKFSDGFTVFLPSVGVAIGYGLSYYLFSLCLKYIPLSLGYAIWSGVGTASATIIGIIIWDELFNSLSLIGIILIVGGVTFLNAEEDSKNVKEQVN